MKRIRVNVLSVINSASKISTETINGKPHIVVRGVTPVVDDIVMNKKLYPAAEIEKGYRTLERNPMPLGHPKVDGKNISARDVQAVNDYHVGAWLQNVNHSDGKVSGDMYVDQRYAEGSEKGKRLLNRLDDMLAGKDVEPIHISTGLLYSGIAANGESKGKRYSEIATNMNFDHVAILLDEPGAGTPEEGVGIFVNSEGEESEIEAVNLSEADQPDADIQVNESLINKLATTITALFSANNKQTKEEVDPMKELIINALKAKGKEVEGKTDAELMDAYNQMQADEAKKETPEEKAAREKKEADEKAAKDAATNSEEIPAWAKKLADRVDSVVNSLNVNADKEKSVKREAVKAHLKIDDLAVNAMGDAALDAVYAQTQKSIGLNGQFQQNSAENSICTMPE